MIDIDGFLLQWFINFFDKKGSGEAIKDKNMSNKELAEELHKPIIRKIKKWKVYLSFIDNNCGADLADMQLLSKFYKGFRFLLCVIDTANIHGLFFWEIKKVLQLLMIYKKF